MRILYATQWFEPEPILKGIYFATQMRDQGHDVRVVTGFPNYPGGRLYPGYKIALHSREMMEGIPVERILLYPSHSRSAVGRLLNYVSFAASLTVYGLFTRKRPDAIYVWHPPLTVGIAVAIIAAVRGIPFVYDIQDMWPDTIAASGMISNRTVLGSVAALCRWVYASADRIVVPSPGYKRVLVERGVPRAKVEVIYNWANELAIRPGGDADLSAFALAGRFNVVFAGNMGLAQGLEAVVRAAKLVEDAAPNVQCILIGGGIEVDRLRMLAAELKARTVRIMPRIPQSEIANLLAAADVLLVHLKDEPLFQDHDSIENAVLSRHGEADPDGHPGRCCGFGGKGRRRRRCQPRRCACAGKSGHRAFTSADAGTRCHGLAWTRLLRSRAQRRKPALDGRSRPSRLLPPSEGTVGSSSASSIWQSRAARSSF